MGKQGSAKSLRPHNPTLDGTFAAKDNVFQHSEMQHGNDKSLGRRVSVGDFRWDDVLVQGLKNEPGKFNACKGVYTGRSRPLWWLCRHVRSIILTILLLGFLFLLDSLMFSIFDSVHLNASSTQVSPQAEV